MSSRVTGIAPLTDTIPLECEVVLPFEHRHRPGQLVVRDPPFVSVEQRLNALIDFRLKDDLLLFIQPQESALVQADSGEGGRLVLVFDVGEPPEETENSGQLNGNSQRTTEGFNPEGVDHPQLALVLLLGVHDNARVDEGTSSRGGG
jgi:hypothetical protein